MRIAPADVLRVHVLRRGGPMCDTVAGFLPAYVAGEEALDPRTLAHVAECIRCQAEIARYRRMLRTLHALKSEREPTPPSVVGAITVGLDQPAGTGRAWVLVAGLATAAGAMGAAGVLIWFGRRQSPA